VASVIALAAVAGLPDTLSDITAAMQSHVRARNELQVMWSGHLLPRLLIMGDVGLPEEPKPVTARHGLVTVVSYGGSRRARTTRARVRAGGRVDDDGSHAGHHPSVVAREWGSPVSAASAAATSDRLART
jgi:hypothetical protein